MSDDFFTKEELDRLRRITLEELEELYEKIVVCNDNLDKTDDDAAAIEELGRLFHTITGTAALAGFEKVSRVASVTEDFLKKDSVLPEIIKEPMAKVIQQLNIRISEIKSDMKE